MNSQQTSPGSLTDRFGRTIDYLRISITDRCDFRCVYCMSDDMTFLPRARILTLEEIVTIAQAFTNLGVNRIRITGGEPLIRRNVLSLFQHLGKIKKLQELLLTTNGSKLGEMADALRQSGVKRINISLDTLNPVKFRQLTRYGELETVLNSIKTARKVGFKRIKINSVILKNRNHTEVVDLVDFAIDQGCDISFIEEMPLGRINSHNRFEAYYSSDLIKTDLQKKFALTAVNSKTGGPSRYFNIAGTTSRVGFISPHSANFCGSCNRVRLTAEGKLLLCLGNEHSVDLKYIIRSNPGNTEKLQQAIINAMQIKPEQHEFNLQQQPVILRYMNATGG